MLRLKTEIAATIAEIANLPEYAKNFSLTHYKTGQLMADLKRELKAKWDLYKSICKERFELEAAYERGDIKQADNIVYIMRASIEPNSNHIKELINKQVA